MGKIYYCLIFVFVLFSIQVSGQTYNWSLSHGGSNPAAYPDEIKDIATDNSGNTYVIGSYGAAMAITGGTPPTATNGGAEDVYLAKYNSTGVIQWYKRLGSTGSDKGFSIIVNPGGSGEIYVAGSIAANQYFSLTSPFIWLGANTPASTRSEEIFVARYNTSGVCEWVKGMGTEFSPSTDQPVTLQLDNLGNVCMAGYVGAAPYIYDQRANTGTPPNLAGPLPFNGVFDIALVKFSTAGALVSSQIIGGAGTDQPTAMCFDASGNMYLAGVFSGTVDLDPSGGVTNVLESSPQGAGDAFLVKYDPSGNILWHGTLKGAAQEPIKGLGIDASGHLYATGTFSGFVNFDLLGGTHTLTSGGASDIFIARYSTTDGSFQYANKIGSSGVNGANAIHVLSSGDHYIAGVFSGTGVDFDPSAGVRNLSSAGGTDAFVAKYNAAGTNTWAIRIGGANDDRANAVGITSDSKVVWAGGFNGANVDVDPGAGVVNLAHVSDVDMFLVSYNECAGAAITTQPVATQSICTGQNATFTVVASGSGLTYLWKKNGVGLADGGSISGATTATLTITGLVAGDAATYTVDVIGCLGTVTSSNSVLTVPSGASITTQPVATQTFCAGATASFSVVASGTGLTYQWKKGGVNLSNGGPISGVTTPNLSISSLVPGDAGSYTVDVSSSGCGAALTSSASALVVNSAPAITGQPVTTQTLCAGAAASFTVTATGTGLTYQWKKGGVNLTNGGTISGATTANLNISSVIAGDAANYTVDVTGSCGSPVTSSVSALVVNTGASISTQPVATQTLCTGNAATFSVTASGSGLTYQWQKGGVNVSNGGTISGATTNALAISSVVTGDADSYTVIVTGTCGSPVTSNASVLTVNTGAAITVQPVATQTLCAGAPASFGVTATGSGLTYQWKKGGINLTNGGTISGVSTSALNISSLVAGDAGSYTVDVTASGCGAAVTSSASVLTVNAAPAITVSPVASQTICVGNPASFSVTATGAGLTYQWRKGGVDLSNIGTISGATTASLSISSLVAGDAGSYTVVVSGTCGSPATSSASVLTVNSGASISTQPIAVQTLCVGDLAVFSVSASGTGLTYQWQRNGVNVVNGGGTNGATTATLSISSVIASSAGDYTVNVTGSGCGTPVTSSISQLVVNSPINISAQPPATQIACTGNAATISATVSGSNLTFQWQKDGVNISDGGTISGAATASLSISNLVSGDAGSYALHITGVCGAPQTTTASVLTVNTGPAITTQPVATQTLCTGSAAAFSVVVSGTGLTYQWQKDGVNVVNGGNISGATTDNLNITSLAASNAGNYTVNISAAGCGAPLISNVSALTVNSSINITTQPAATQTLCTGNAAAFTVMASGTGITYQWQKDGVNISDGGTISGATTANLNISSLVSADAGSYTVNMTGACAPATSNASVLTVNTGASITTQPVASQTVCTGATASFSVAATGSGLTYQWRLNGADLTDGGNISGATTATLALSSVGASDAGDYTVAVTASGCGSALTSAISTLTVNTPVTMTTQPVASQTLCTGNAASFTAAATGSGLTYQWQKDGVDVTDGGAISGATTTSLAISSLVAADAGTYTLDVTGTCGSPVTSSASVLTVNIGATITTQPVASQVLCAGSAASFTVTASGTGLSYQWKLDGVNLTDGGTISGATTATLDISSVSTSNGGDYTVDISVAGCGAPITSTISSLTINTPVSITTQPVASQTLCTGNAASFTAAATGSGLTYQWQKDGVDVTDGGAISGATTTSLAISSLVAADAGTYTLDVTGACGSPVTSSASVLTVNIGATITTQPVASQVLCAGSAASFTVTASGTGLSYQWKLDGVNLTDGGTISGATTATLDISSVATSNGGDYTVDIAVAGCGAPITSTISSLTVNTPVSITTQPVASQTLCTGNAASFTAAATGSGLTYQWQKDGVDVTDGGTISGATTAALGISSLVAADAGSYTLNITGVCGSPVTSNASALTVNIGASITNEPAAAQTVCTGTAVSFSVTATGSSLTYQWKRGGVNLTNGGTVSGATTATLNISSAAAADAGNYTVDVSAAGCGTPLTSTVSALTVNNSIVISSQPVANQSLCTGSTATMQVIASGTGISYQWQKDGVNLTDGGTISGATTATLTIASAVVGDGGNYTVDITGACGTVTSATSVLSVTGSVTITMQPTNVNACAGETTNFDLTATGPGLTFQWRKDGVNLVDGGNISGAQTSSLVFLAVSASDAGVYDCVISSSCGAPVTSNAVTLTVGAGIAITKQPISSVICLGQPASFTIQAPGATSYRWQFKPAAGVYADLANGSGISGTTTPTLIITGTQFDHRGNYRCIVTGGSCSGGVTSAAASLSFQSPSIVSQPLSQSVCTGQTITFGVVALGNNLTYQWLKNGTFMTNGGRVSGAQSATLKITNADLADEATYQCLVQGLCPPPTYSDMADLTLTTCTGITEAIDGTLFNIYPNPSTGIYHLDMDLYAAGTLTYEVFNTLGEKLFGDEVHGEGKVVSVVDLSDQVAGVYIIKLNYDDRHAWLRLVLEK